MSVPRFSIVIPAHNEEDFLPQCLEAVHKAIAYTGEEAEIIVADNMSTDRTAEIAVKLGANVVSVEERSISTVRNTGAAQATGKFLVFVDSDSYMTEKLLQEIGRSLESGRYIGGGVANFRPDRISLGIAITYFFIYCFIAVRRLSWACFYMRRETFDEVGRFDEGILATEDIDFAKRLKKFGRKQGLRYRNIANTVLYTSARKFDEYGDWMAFTKMIKFFRIIIRQDSDAIQDFWYRSRR